MDGVDLMGLPVEEREVIELRYLVGLPCPRLADLLGVPVERVDELLVSARARLQRAATAAAATELPSAGDRLWA